MVRPPDGRQINSQDTQTSGSVESKSQATRQPPSFSQVDGIGIGIGLLVLGIPLALPLASLVFLGAFVPFVGAMVTGFLAVVIAILAKGWLYGLFTLGLVLAVQQLEGNVLQPLIMGRAVRLHPLAVLVALTAGGVVAGIIGVLLAVPLLAFLDHAVRSLLDSRETPPAQGGAVP